MSDDNHTEAKLSEKELAHAARGLARRHDPWGYVRPLIIAFFSGAATMAAMDYGDLWICAGDCMELIEGDTDD